MQDLFAKGRAKPMDFGVGYRWRPNESNLLLAVRDVVGEGRREALGGLRQLGAEASADRGLCLASVYGYRLSAGRCSAGTSVCVLWEGFVATVVTVHGTFVHSPGTADALNINRRGEPVQWWQQNGQHLRARCQATYVAGADGTRRRGGALHVALAQQRDRQAGGGLGTPGHAARA